MLVPFCLLQLLVQVHELDRRFLAALAEHNSLSRFVTNDDLYEFSNVLYVTIPRREKVHVSRFHKGEMRQGIVDGKELGE